MPLFSFCSSTEKKPPAKAPASARVKWEPYDEELRRRAGKWQFGWSGRDKALVSQTEMLDYAAEGPGYTTMRARRKQGLHRSSDECETSRLVLDIADVDIGGGEVIHTLRARIVAGAPAHHKKAGGASKPVISASTAKALDDGEKRRLDPESAARSSWPAPSPPSDPYARAGSLSSASSDRQSDNHAEASSGGVSARSSQESLVPCRSPVCCCDAVPCATCPHCYNANEGSHARGSNAAPECPLHSANGDTGGSDDRNRDEPASNGANAGDEHEAFGSAAGHAPLVFIHGMFGGVALWALNIREIVEAHPSQLAYFIDVPGFGRSTRAKAAPSKTSAAGEAYFVTRIDSWRTRVGISKMDLLGHSLGGYLAACVAMQHPSTVQRLVLCDPWGVPERTVEDAGRIKTYPWWVRFLASIADKSGPLFILRAAGPLAPFLLSRARSDLVQKWGAFYQEDEASSYIYHCNTQSPPTGEVQFMSLQIPFAFARDPLCNRLAELPRDIPVHFVYGARTWMSISSGKSLAAELPHRTTFHLVPDAAHHVYLDNHAVFNATVSAIINDNATAHATCVQSKTQDLVAE
ncbi:Abhydrolase domain-containing protein cgi-58 [Diplonema papillatum]|nr:Abhydrolase domain-containing protein cgi-58 [Diplonema papillatum]